MRKVYYEIELLTTLGQRFGEATTAHADLLKQAGFAYSELRLAKYYDQDPNRVTGYRGTPEVFTWLAVGVPSNLTYLRLTAAVVKVHKHK